MWLTHTAPRDFLANFQPFPLLLMSRDSLLVSRCPAIVVKRTRRSLWVRLREQSIAFSDGEDVHFANAAKFTRTAGRVCRGGRRGRSLSGGSGDRAAVTALAFDAVSTGLLYVGFETGEVMVRARFRLVFDGSFWS